jgi:hypothetical protein
MIASMYAPICDDQVVASLPELACSKRGNQSMNGVSDPRLVACRIIDPAPLRLVERGELAELLRQ